MKQTSTTLTPERLNGYRLDRGWSVQELADHVFTTTGIRLHARTLSRFIDEEHGSSEVTLATLTKYFETAANHGAVR